MIVYFLIAVNRINEDGKTSLQSAENRNDLEDIFH